VRVILLGSPGYPGELLERWHDDAYEGAQQLGWDVSFLRARDHETAQVVDACRGADMLLWMRTHDYNIRGDDGRVMLRKVEDLGVTTVGLHFDLYWGVGHRQQRVGKEPWWSAQHVFTADGGDRPWERVGVNHHWCPPPFGTRFLGYGIARRELRRRAVFVGSNIPSIHQVTRGKMLRWAMRSYGPGFRHIGRHRGGRVYGRELNDVYASCDVVLGDSVFSPYYWSDRLPRTLGRGALFAYPDTPGLDEWGFTSDVMIRFDPGQFHQIAHELSAMTPDRRRDMTDAAITLIRDRHLWRHRLEHIAEVALNGASDYRGGRTSEEVGELPRGSFAPGPGRR
jgi:hypothetical protein